MPWPDLDLSENFETFFEPTRIWLFGKEFRSLKYVRESMFNEFTRFTPDQVDEAGDLDPEHTYPDLEKSLALPPRRIERTLRRVGFSQDKKPIERVFARIYSFSFEGYYYKLPRPMLFLVSGVGDPIAEHKPAVQGQTANNPNNPAAAKKGEKRGHKPQKESKTHRLTFNTKYTGLDAREWVFSEDICVWQVDRKDMAVCLDIEIGNYQEILLDTMVAASRRAAASRGEISSRGEITSRGEIGSRGAGSFRGEIVGPHHNW